MKKLAIALVALSFSSLLAVNKVHGQATTVTATPTATATSSVPPPPPPPGGNPTATPTATPSPTATPVPLTITAKLARRNVKGWQWQRLIIKTLPFASLYIHVRFPNHQTDSITAAANTYGNFKYTFIQIPMTRHKGQKVVVSIKATSGTMVKTATKHYTFR